MSEFNSDDHYIYYCGQESLRRNGVAIMVNKRVRNADFGCLADRGDPLAGTAGAPEEPSWRLGPGGQFFLGAKMDIVLSIADYYVFTPYIYPATWPEDNIFRQAITLLIVTNLGALILYFFFATLSYYFVYDHLLMKHPQFLKNQVS